jgi:O-antigen/teichoic acid export membrane protein
VVSAAFQLSIVTRKHRSAVVSTEWSASHNQTPIIMRKFEKTQILKNVGSSWSALVINILVGIFLTPIIVHRLGDTAYGIWVMIFSITGYYGMFDLGIRSSIVRYVSKFTATRESEGLARHINTSLFTYTVIGMLAMTVTVALTLSLHQLFPTMNPGMLSQARWLMLMAGGSVALGFPLGVLGGILDGLQRFYITNWTAILSTLLRAALIVYALHQGRGLLTVAAITVSMPILTSILRGFIVSRLLPLPLGLKYVDRESFKQMAHYSATTSIVIVAAQLRFRTNELIVGKMISMAAVTYFTFGSRLVDYSQQLVISLGQIFVPMSSQSEAVGNLDRLRKLYVVGNRACAFIIYPMCAALLILGKSAIEAWVGHKYVASSYPITVILAIPMTLFLMQGASGRILLGMGKQRDFAFVVLMEGIANLILSIFLVRPFGIAGDAMGTAIPMLLTTLWFLPRHMRKQLGVPVKTLLREAYMLPLLLAAPLAATLLVLQHWRFAHNLRQLAFQSLVGGAVYGAGLLWAYRSNRLFHVGDLKLIGEGATTEGLELPPMAAGYAPEEEEV